MSEELIGQLLVALAIERLREVKVTSVALRQRPGGCAVSLQSSVLSPSVARRDYAH
jgi:hypothetical protein